MIPALTFGEVAQIVGWVGVAFTFMFAKPTVDSMIRYGNWRMQNREKLHALRMAEKAADAAAAVAQEDRKARQRAIDEAANDKGYKEVIRRQDKRITDLEETVLATSNREHQCREELAALKVEIASVREDCKELREEMASRRRE